MGRWGPSLRPPDGNKGIKVEAPRLANWLGKRHRIYSLSIPAKDSTIRSHSYTSLLNSSDVNFARQPPYFYKNPFPTGVIMTISSGLLFFSFFFLCPLSSFFPTFFPLLSGVSTSLTVRRETSKYTAKAEIVIEYRIVSNAPTTFQRRKFSFHVSLSRCGPE